MSLPPPLPPQGFLLEPFGFLTEPLAAIAIDLQPATLIEYRKAGIGPEYAIVGRTVLYSRDNLKKWLENGVTRAFEQGPTRDAALAERPKTRKPKTAQRDVKVEASSTESVPIDSTQSLSTGRRPPPPPPRPKRRITETTET